jgi:hypothetical protein
MQVGLHVKQRQHNADNHADSSFLEMAAGVDADEDASTNADAYPAVIAERLNIYTVGSRWRQAAVEAGLNPFEVSEFGRSIPKFTASEVQQLTRRSLTTKRYRYNFQGGACSLTDYNRKFNIYVKGPAYSRRWRRKWATDFARSNFSDQDFWKVTDRSKCHDYVEPMGLFDHSFSHEDEDYWSVLAASNFTLCPGGDEPWSMRVYEAVAAGSLPMIASRQEDLSPEGRGDRIGVALGAVHKLFHVADASNPIYSQELVEANRRIFIKYHTFMEGDNVPPGIDFDAELVKILDPPVELYQENRAKLDAVCIDAYRRGLNEIREDLGNFVQPSFFQAAKTSNKRLILGAGFGTTATRSVWTVLQDFGLNVSHCGETENQCRKSGLPRSQIRKPSCDIPGATNILAPEYMQLFTEPQRMMGKSDVEQCLNLLSSFDYTNIPTGLNAIMDTPVAELFLYLWRSFPKAKVILTTRNATDWAAARFEDQGLEKEAKAFAPMQNPCGRFLQYPKESPFTKDELRQLFLLHGDLVQCIVPMEQLFVVNLFRAAERGLQMELKASLARFLDVRPTRHAFFQDNGFPRCGDNHTQRSTV